MNVHGPHVKHILNATLALVACAGFLVTAGCETGGQTGALAGGGIGALAGQAIGGDTTSTLIGAAVGAGVGYLVGNEADKKHAEEMSNTSAAQGYTHSEVGNLGGTKWLLVSLNPQDYVPAYTSKVIEFRPNGMVVSTTTAEGGDVTQEEERYRVVGDTVIINRDDYLINARYRIDGDHLILNADKFSAVLRRMKA